MQTRRRSAEGLDGEAEVEQELPSIVALWAFYTQPT